MIIHNCIYCDELSMIPCGPPGAWSKETCEACGKISWLKHSRIDPESYTEDKIEVDEKTKTIKIKGSK